MLDSADTSTYKQTFRLVHVDDRGPECSNRFRFEVGSFAAWRSPVDRRKRTGNVDDIVGSVRHVSDAGSGLLELDVVAVFACARCWKKNCRISNFANDNNIKIWNDLSKFASKETITLITITWK